MTHASHQVCPAKCGKIAGSGDEATTLSTTIFYVPPGGQRSKTKGAQSAEQITAHGQTGVAAQNLGGWMGGDTEGPVQAEITRTVGP